MDSCTLARIIRDCWTAETSYDPENWSEQNPAWGQCAVTAVIVQDYLGGEILWTEAELPDGQKIHHFFNRLNGAQGGEIDLTREQFPEGTVLPPGMPKENGCPS